MSLTYFAVLSSINQLFCRIEFFSEIRVLYSIITYQINLAANYTLKVMNKAKKQIGPVKTL